MTGHQPEHLLDDERDIDLLVDGELDEARRRELLLRLESTPEGWRRCALAFLEARAWQDGSCTWVHEPRMAAGPLAISTNSAAQSSFWQGARGNLLAVAASFGLVFALGAWYRSDKGGMNNASMVGADGPLTHTTPDVDATLASGRSADSNGYVTLVVDGVADGESNEFRLPVRSWQGPRDTTLAEEPLGLPKSLVQQIEQAGHTVRQRRELVPVDLQDGRQMIVPMDEVQIVPVSRTFQ